MIRKLKYSFVLFLTLLLCAVTFPSFAGEKYIFVLAGQSNMVGASGEKIGSEQWRDVNKTWQNGGSVWAERKAENDFDQAIIDNKIEGRVKYWQVGMNGQGAFYNLSYKPGAWNREKVQMHQITDWKPVGPNLGPYFAAEFLIKLNDPTAEVYLVGNAAAATGFSLTVNNMSWSPFRGAKHNLQSNMRWHATNAAKAVPDAKVAGLLWLQGESDHSMGAAEYAKMVKTMVYNFRTKVPRALNARFLVATVMPTWRSDPANQKYLNDADKAHRTIIPVYPGDGISDTQLVDTIAMKGMTRYINIWEVAQKKTPLHYSALALRKIGRCFAAKAQKTPLACEEF